MSTYPLKRACRGFTLIELMVSVAIFSTTMVLITGAYITILGYTRQAEATATATDNLAFVIENIVRTIRTGTAYNCNGQGDCPSGAVSLSFKDNSNSDVSYAFVPPSGETKGYITATFGSASPDTLTDPSINVTSLKFIVTGTSITDTITPTVRILVSGRVPGFKNNTPLDFSLETLATMRGIDL